MLKKGDPPDGNDSLSPRQEAPGQAATIKNCSSKKQLFENMLKQVFVISSEMWIGRKIIAENVDWVNIGVEF